MTADRKVEIEQIKLKARQLRYKKPISKDISIYSIREKLYEITEDCDEVQYWFENDVEELVDAMDGDEDDAREFMVSFSDLSSECEMFLSDMEQEYVPEYFDEFFPALENDGLLGYDSFERDYYGLSPYESRLANEESKKKMARLTKKELLEVAMYCFNILRAYVSLCYRYDCLKASLDILKEKNGEHIKVAKRVEELYEICEKENFDRYYAKTIEFENLVAKMPNMAWIQ